MVKILSVYNRLKAGDNENGNGGKRRVSRLTQFIQATLQLFAPVSDHLKAPGSTFGEGHHASLSSDASTPSVLWESTV